MKGFFQGKTKWQKMAGTFEKFLNVLDFFYYNAENNAVDERLT